MKSKPHLFPCPYLIEPEIKRLVSFFGPVRIYHPWFFNAPEFLKDLNLEIVNPPEGLKPRGDFKAMLSGYRAWAEQNHDRSLKEMAKFSDNPCHDCNSTWEIRRLLRGKTQQVRKEEADALKWHLLLHLSADLERQHYDLMGMMDALKKKAPVLAEALGDPGEAKGIFAEKDDPKADELPHNLDIGLILDAWFGMFGGYLKEDDLLITYTRHVFDYISSQWDERETDRETVCPQVFSFTLPDLSREGLNEGDIGKVRELMLGFGRDPDCSMQGLFSIIKDIREEAPRGSSQGGITFRIRHFSSIGGQRSLESNGLLRHIAGKTIIQMSST